jgi:hypothetical protein
MTGRLWGSPFLLGIIGTAGWVAAVGALALAARRKGAPRLDWILIGVVPDRWTPIPVWNARVRLPLLRCAPMWLPRIAVALQLGLSAELLLQG